MTLTLTYYHDSSEIRISFYFNAKEVAVAIGFGETCRDARDNLRGWYGKNQIETGKTYKCDKEKPFIALRKKDADGKVTALDSCINMLEDFPSGKSNQISIKEWAF